MTQRTRGTRAKLQRIRVDVEPAYEVRIGVGAHERAARELRPTDVVLRDSGVPAGVAELHAATTIALAPGEEAKEWSTLASVLAALADEACDRSTRLFVVGGGAALDLGGLAAALYLRGVEAVYCPTTLLAMVDASVGGKTAINLEQGKNLVGVIRQPSAVYADPRWLASLPEAEFRSGLGEALKSAVIGGERFLAQLERDAARLVARDEAALVELVARCVELKARIVARDPHERGPRRALNLGHTFAHAVEHVAGYGVVPHGIAVAAGLALALELAARTGVLADDALPARVRALAAALGLPASLDELRSEYGLALAPRALATAMRSDKKSVRAEPRFVLPARAGKLELRVGAAAELVLAVCAPAAKQGRARRARARRARRMRSSPKPGS